MIIIPRPLVLEEETKVQISKKPEFSFRNFFDEENQMPEKIDPKKIYQNHKFEQPQNIKKSQLELSDYVKRVENI